tara:strand:+ start:3131 stop:3505 length:375 start_codon:yes stop_codon:yes gene_type:complete
MKAYLVVLVAMSLSGCAALADFALDKVTGGSNGGINTELVVGDKEQTLGNNIEVKADNVGKVVGENDNTTHATGAEFVEVNNFSYPSWVVPVLLSLTIVFLALPMPGKWPNMIRNLFNGKRTDE